tara:strand:+ start:3122 stop:4357 length:1236 start_codon:yes stop_codon:yes gene_type:complete
MYIETPEKRYDLVVIGGGMVGTSFACALCSEIGGKQLSILVVEAFPHGAGKAQQPSFDARSTALSYGSRCIYDEIGLWRELSNQVTPIKEIHVSDKGHFGLTRLNHIEHDVEALGYVVENRQLGSVLNNEVKNSPAIQMISPAQVEQIRPTSGSMQLAISRGGSIFTIEASLVVLAEGGKSTICDQLGIDRVVDDYNQHALIANIAFEKPHKNVAYERFTDTGPLAILPLESFDGENRGCLVWTVATNQSDEIQAMGTSALTKLLMDRFGNRLGKITHIGERFGYPLTLSIAKEQIRPGLVLLGNVAHTLHPVAGQGLNLALRDTMVLVSRLGQAVRESESLGSMTVLQDYVDRQSFDQQKTITFTDQLTRIFSNNQRGRVLARKLGLLSIELIPPLRRGFAEQAMGLGSR